MASLSSSSSSMFNVLARLSQQMLRSLCHRHHELELPTLVFSDFRNAPSQVNDSYFVTVTAEVTKQAEPTCTGSKKDNRKGRKAPISSVSLFMHLIAGLGYLKGAQIPGLNIESNSPGLAH